MITYFKDIEINYEVRGKGDKAIIFLHGWGGSIESFSLVADKFIGSHKVLLIDFPPFGKSEEPYEVWNIDDYCELVKEICQKERISHSTIIAHSFGGRVAIMLANRYNSIVDKMVLTSSAGLKRRKSLKTKCKILCYKMCKIFGYKRDSLGSEDWQKLSPLMKGTFVNIVNHDQTKEAKSVLQETLLVWGDKDYETPLSMGKKLHKLIKNSELIVFKDCSHFAYLENYYTFVNVVKTFIEG